MHRQHSVTWFSVRPGLLHGFGRQNHTQHQASSVETLQRWRSSLKHAVFNLSHCPVIGSTVSSVLPVCTNGRLDSIKTNVCQMLRPGNELVFLGRGFFLVTVVQVAQHVCYLHGSWSTGSLDNSVFPDKCCIRCIVTFSYDTLACKILHLFMKQARINSQ